jgi:hypothetical protein
MKESRKHMPRILKTYEYLHVFGCTRNIFLVFLSRYSMIMECLGFNDLTDSSGSLLDY